MREPFSVAGLGRRELGRVYEQSLAGEYLRWARHWIASGGDGYLAERLSGTDAAPGVCVAGPRGAPVALTFGHGLDGPIDPGLLDRVEAMHRETWGEPVIEVSPYADAGYLGLLRARGYGPVEYLHTFALDLSLFNEPPPALGDDLRLRELEKSDADAVERAAHAIARGVNGELPEPTPLRLEWARMVCGCPDALTLVVEDMRGVVVAGASSGVWRGHPLMPEGNCNLFAGSTLPRARRRGIQRALMVERLRRAKAAGCRAATLDCLPTAGTVRNAERLGFELVYTKTTFTRPPG